MLGVLGYPILLEEADAVPALLALKPVEFKGLHLQIFGLTRSADASLARAVPAAAALLMV
jgi:hypothetical protein